MLRNKRLARGKIMAYVGIMVVMFGGAGAVLYLGVLKPSGQNNNVPANINPPVPPAGMPAGEPVARPEGAIPLPPEQAFNQPSAEDPASIFEMAIFNERQQAVNLSRNKQVKFLTRHPTILTPVSRLRVLNSSKLGGPGNKVFLSWIFPEDERITKLVVARSEKAGQVGEKLAELQPMVETYQDNTVIPNRTYYYTVTPQAEGYSSPFSWPLEVTTKDTIRPVPPTDITISQEGEAVKISWKTSVDAVYYRVYRSTEPGRVGDIVADRLPRSVTSYEDKTAEFNTNYYYLVTALDEVFNESATGYLTPNPGNSNPFGA